MAGEKTRRRAEALAILYLMRNVCVPLTIMVRDKRREGPETEAEGMETEGVVRITHDGEANTQRRRVGTSRQGHQRWRTGGGGEGDVEGEGEAGG